MSRVAPLLKHNVRGGFAPAATPVAEPVGLERRVSIETVRPGDLVQWCGSLLSRRQGVSNEQTRRQLAAWIPRLTDQTPYDLHEKMTPISLLAEQRRTMRQLVFD